MRRRTFLAVMGFVPVLPIAGGAPERRIPLGMRADGLQLVIRQANDSGVVYFAPHDNENIAVQAVERLWQTRPLGTLVELRQTGSERLRYVYQHIGGTKIYGDPNRIFADLAVVRRELGRTRGGRACGRVINRSVTGAHIKRAAAHFQQIGRQITDVLGEYLHGPAPLLVGLHNNTEGRLGVGNPQLRAGGPVSARPPYRHQGEDPDDFLLVTQTRDFEQLRQSGFNVVLQKPAASDDGSLSVWATRQRPGIRYIAVEAQHVECLSARQARGHLDVQLRMLEAITGDRS